MLFFNKCLKSCVLSWHHEHASRTWPRVNVQHEMMVSVFLVFIIQCIFVRQQFVPFLMKAHAYLRGTWFMYSSSAEATNNKSLKGTRLSYDISEFQPMKSVNEV